MDLITFLSTIIQKKDQSLLPSVICFSAKNYPALFFYYVRMLFKANGYIIQLLDSELFAHDASLRAQLETSFLGTTKVYWLNDSGDLDNKQQQALGNYVQEYKGPHTIVFFNAKPLSVITSIQLPNEVDAYLYKSLCSLFFPEFAKKNKEQSLIFKKYKSIPLDQACLLMHYSMVIGAKYESDFLGLLDAIVVPGKSLFTLSSYFFSRQDKEFFKLWHVIRYDYPDIFWTTFWSEQLFRAYAFVELMRKNDMVQAKKSAYRLPFSFVQKEWKHLSLQKLVTAHEQITTIDWNIKNGLSSHFEHFYLNFFNP